MILLGYLVLGIIILFFLFYISIFLIQGEKNKRNPVPLMTNYEKRFKKIERIYSHKFNEIERRD